jgi:ABC-2 type transport system permease protein
VRLLRLFGFAWWYQLKLRSRSAFDGFLALLYPIFFVTSILLMFRQGHASEQVLVATALGASVLGIWSAVSTPASAALQHERFQGTLELLAAAPVSIAAVLLSVTMSMATVGAASFVTTLLYGRFVFGIPVHVGHPGPYALGVLVTVLGVGALGFLLAVSTVRYRSAWAVGTMLEVPVWLVGGFIVPLATLPGWVRPLSYALAPTWGMKALQHAAFGGPWLGDAVLCLALGTAYLLLGSLLCRRLVHSARAHASLALA